MLGKLNAQQDFILYHMPSIPQITQVDPASIPDSKVDIGLPVISGIYGSAFNTGFSFGDIFSLHNLTILSAPRIKQGVVVQT